MFLCVGNRIFYWFRLHFRLLQFATEFSVAVLRENALVEARNCLSHLCKHPRAIINEHGAPGYLHQILQAIYGGGRSPAKPSSSSTISTTTTTATATSTSTRICSSSSSSGSSTSGSRDESPDIPILLSPITRMSSGYGLQEMLVGIMVKMLPNVVDGKRSEREEKLKGMLAAFPGFAAEVVMEMARRDVVANNSNRENEKNNVASEDRIVRVKRERERGRERERDRDRARAESTDKKSKRSRPD